MNVREAKENLRRGTKKAESRVSGSKSFWPLIVLVFIAGGIVGFVPALRRRAFRSAGWLYGSRRNRLL